MRGSKSEDGATRIAPNGYHYTKQSGKWRLTHHIKMEEILGRKLAEDERVHFKTGNKQNFAADNLQLVKKGKSNARRRLAQIEARIDELTAERDRLRAEIESE